MSKVRNIFQPPTHHPKRPTPAMGDKECHSKMLIFQNKTQSCVPKADISHFCQIEVCLWTHRNISKPATIRSYTDLSPSLLSPFYVLNTEGVEEDTVIKLPRESINCFLPSVLFIPVFKVKLLSRNKGFEIILKIP